MFMFKVNILGKNKFTFEEIFNHYDYGDNQKYDFDFFDFRTSI